MNATNCGVGVRCPGCLCDLRPTREYGADVQCCSRCGGLWIGRHGLSRLTAHLPQKRLDLSLAWHELGALLGGDQRPAQPERPCRREGREP
ncbi:MAG: zf-TFIIB domain-containing protein [Armatimonadetes bacterium]|nr:zf-TFIIB domain-containing protein [Armatimonadota bacterium]